MQIDFSDVVEPKKTRAWITDNPGFAKPDWWHKVTYTLQCLYYNHGPKILETVKVEDYLIHR